MAGAEPVRDVEAGEEGIESESGDDSNARGQTLDARRIALYVGLVLLAAFYLAPLETGLMTAIKTQGAIIETTPFQPPGPDGFSLEAWGTAFERLQGSLTNTNGSLFNSLLFAVPATVLSATIGSITAYGLTHVHWKGQIAILLVIIAGVFLPYQSVLVPLTRFWLAVDLQSILGGVPFLGDKIDLVELTITHTAYGIPICVVLFRGYYLSFDEEMLEAARLDGASIWRIYRRIVLPLSTPMFAVVLIYQFTQIWNDLLFALVLVSSTSDYVVTLQLNSFQGQFGTAYDLQMAAAFIAAAPTLIVYVLFGRQFAEGVAGGGA